MSEHVVHVVRGSSAAESYANIISILASGVLFARNPFGAARDEAPDAASQNSVCFSEVPVDLLTRVIERRLPRDRSAWHGIAFSKPFLTMRGGGPILYAYDGTPQAEAVRELVLRARSSSGGWSDPIWKLTPFVDLPGRRGSYYFEWEREWRHVGNLSFGPEDVSYLLMPEEYHESARDFFDEAALNDTGPAYRCPFLDATWDRQRCAAALASGRRAPGR